MLLALLGQGASLYASRYYYKSSFSNSGYWANGNGIIHSFSELERKPNGKYTRGVQGLRNARKYAQVRSAKWRMAGKVSGWIGIISAAGDFFRNANLQNSLSLVDAVGSHVNVPYSAVSTYIKVANEARKENIKIVRYNLENNLPPSFGIISSTGDIDYSSGFLMFMYN